MRRIGRGIGVFGVPGFEDLGHAFGELRDALGEVLDGVFPDEMVGLAVLEEKPQEVDELIGFGKITVEGNKVILMEDGATGSLKKNVGERVACFGLLLDFIPKVIGFVLGLPEAVN